MPTFTNYNCDFQLHNSQMINADNTHNPLRIGNTPESRKWLEDSIVVAGTTMLNYSSNYTGFHFDDCGFSTCAILYYGGVKIWFLVHRQKENIAKFIALVNRIAEEGGGISCPCPGILGSKSYGITPEMLHEAGVKFSVVRINYLQLHH